MKSLGQILGFVSASKYNKLEKELESALDEIVHLHEVHCHETEKLFDEIEQLKSHNIYYLIEFEDGTDYEIEADRFRTYEDGDVCFWKNDKCVLMTRKPWTAIHLFYDDEEEKGE